ncbi:MULTISPECIES: cadmium resistance transporter [Cellulosimicrobium]|uniref:Cadmium transporter n=1 Tax=Cellulosimicrobium funkei TaxID=264251 RepID=A0A4Y8R2T8_9MICO|nr:MULTISPECIES: cadmium resistance transporter [Cellulosimicrobium]TGA77436.1 cadmium transporter [Cellulosimicrobium terreum]TWG79097.1 cadmium resistance transport/sequestration family protein [Cellulosimicrobium cellulans J34]UTT57616.1 cadmium resistance transporter [Cellulosimicrobium cellulans]SMF46787.1 cadmium resistance transporter (or sequestration) family protein [Cellulosimicrobium cellulans J1]ARK03871.1 cadmium transporter [Cellulosimicrobium sp. TH-20]
MLSTIAAAVGLFVATNLDDIVVLTVLFAVAARGTSRLRGWQIVAGQYLGLVTLIAVSFLAALGLTIVPDEWVGLLGLIPLAIGVLALVRTLRGKDDDDEAESALKAVGLLGVAGITIANGGDNIAIYTPVFRTISTTDALVTIAVFLVLLALWCLLARAIGTNEKVTEGLEKVEHWLVPVVFIGLGVFILIESGTLAHIASLL